MKILIAPDSFKGSLSAREVALAIELGLSHALPSASLVTLPMSDGGEGLLDCLMNTNEIVIHHTRAHDPLGREIESSFGIFNDHVAVIESAKACGLSLLTKEERNPLKSSTRGVGELIKAALDKGCQQFIIGLGGSATSDGGIGALASLGVQFKNHKGEEVEPNAKGLLGITNIDVSKLDPRLHTAQFTLAHDVNNPFLGLEGALLYAPQKGATPSDVELLHKSFEHYASLLSNILQKNVGLIPGTGAAGGLAMGLFAFLNASLKPGALITGELLSLREKIKNATLVITGEGQIDHQTVFGKTPIRVAKIAQELHVPVIAIAAILGKGYHTVYEHGINAVFSIANGPISPDICLLYTKPLLMATANNIGRLLAIRHSA